MTPHRTELSFSPMDFQDHSTPHMKTRIAVRDRNPHRFQIVALREAKHTTLQPPKQQGLHDITNTCRLQHKKLKAPAPLNINKTGADSEQTTSNAYPTSTLPKLRRRSNVGFTSKLPTPSNRTRTDVGECPDRRHTRILSFSNPSTPTLHPIISAETKTLALSTRNTMPSYITPASTNNNSSNKPPKSHKTTSAQRSVTSRMPFSFKSKIPFQTRTFDSAQLRSKHGTAHSVDVINLKGSLALPIQQTRRRQDVRAVFSDRIDDPAFRSATPTPLSSLRLRDTAVKSATPSKRHAIYTHSLYFGRCSQKISNCAVDDLIPPPLQPLSQTSESQTLSTSSQIDSIESIVQVYQEEKTGPQSCSFSMGLPSSLSEPTLHDISNVAVSGMSLSLTSLPSVYSQDSWISGKHQSIQMAKSNKNGEKGCAGYHPIIWELLQKLEIEEKGWQLDE